MATNELLGLVAGAVLLGAVHGVEPGHGWPVAASYALDQANKWVYGFAASLILGVGHLVSSIAMVGVFFYAKAYFDLTQVNEPITVLGGVQIGGPVSLVAGVLLIVLGIREYTHGHSHGTHGHDDDDHGGHSHGHDHGHEHSHDGDQSHSRDHDGNGLFARLKRFVPFVGGHSHSHGDLDDAADRGLLGIAWFAFVLGFAHEEEFEIIALCAGSNYCLELMSAYAVTVVVGIVGLTMLLIAGYEQYEDEVEKYTPYLPAFSAAVLVLMGLGFITGLF
ncbi:hypothetical protein C5B89_01925 [Haloferax sp. Atlit-47N]|uniref:hypothetical protein n=1 Tax=Haloferax sp. Atlit-47N TaxID=2077199 RepID=UPI000E23A88E|nr:hypothetical protein [Haloferax sp. Atlit-47N]RDZ40737.1 hypothetical protein C5B89_01925 [Haloferax sp. Atlit-47N]